MMEEYYFFRGYFLRFSSIRNSYIVLGSLVTSLVLVDNGLAISL